MSKRIKFERQEDIRVTYVWSLDEKEWNYFKQYITEENEDAKRVLENVSFDDAIKNIQDSDAKPIFWKEKIGNIEYNANLYDSLCDYMRDEAIEAGAIDESYYDDGGDEEICIEDVPEFVR